MSTITVTENTSRYDSIANSIRAALAPVTDADVERLEAKEEFGKKQDGSVNAREEVMQALALHAMQGKWSEKEIKIAVPLVISKGNAETPKAVATFIGECKHAMHPSVRVVFANLVGVRNAAWDAEAQEFAIDKSAPTPVKKAFARKYHALIALMTAAAEGSVMDVDGFIAFAVSRDPDMSPEKCAKAVEQAMKKLAQIAATFPDTDLGAAVDMLAKVNKKTLAAARAEIHGEEPEVPTTVVQKALPASLIPSTESGQDIVEGASDILEEILESV